MNINMSIKKVNRTTSSIEIYIFLIKVDDGENKDSHTI